ncbi:MAG: phosphate acyltransferase PlsX [Clostridia bacterium]|nr:phosphate acyltransferase PlsX [Clostridia bacterium]
MIKLIIDTMGGDNSPRANVEGSVSALRAHPDLYVIFSGDEAQIKPILEELEYTDDTRYEILHAPDVITGEDKPTDAIRLKRESSMMKGIKMLRENDDIAGMVSTGATGSLVAAATVRIGRIRGLIRPAFCPVFSTMAGTLVGVCDSGANVDCTPEQLLQFSVMGSLYMQYAFGIENPRIAMLNIGTETEKGDVMHKEAFKLIAAAHGDNFVGNMEGRDLLSGNYDIIVADGFSGNVLIKTTEGTALSLLKKIKSDIYSRGMYKFGAIFLKKMFEEEKELLNYQNYGGSVLLGTEKIIVKGHGSSNAIAVRKCIEQAMTMEKNNLNDKIAERIADLYKAQAQ